MTKVFIIIKGIRESSENLEIYHPKETIIIHCAGDFCVRIQ